MVIFRFVKWWWAKNDWCNRTIALLIFTTILPACIASIWIGEAAVNIIFVGGSIVGTCWAIYGLFYWFRGMYREFIDECPPEDEAIIRKLKGIPTPSKKKEDLHEYY